eukprot:13542153-Heterocapsa_arctica.AAC.1
MSTSAAGPRANGMALSGSNDDDDEQEASIVYDFPPGAPGAAEEEELPESDFRGSCVRCVGDVRGSGGAE